MPLRRSAQARVTFTVEVDVRSAWGEKCDLAQVYTQAEREARSHVEQAFLKERRARIIGKPKIEAIIVERDER